MAGFKKSVNITKKANLVLSYVLFSEYDFSGLKLNCWGICPNSMSLREGKKMYKIIACNERRKVPKMC